jgi:rhodanese-related sulfurtransferase
MKSLLPIVMAAMFGSFLMAAPEEKNEEKSAIQHVDAKAAAKLLASDDKKKAPVILDIRTPDEFKEGHLKGAKNIDFFEDSFEAEVAKLDKDKNYLVHCKSGGRSTKSLKVFKKLGFKNIYHLDGGFIAWEEAEQEVVK